MRLHGAADDLPAAKYDVFTENVPFSTAATVVNAGNLSGAPVLEARGHRESYGEWRDRKVAIAGAEVGKSSCSTPRG